MKYNLAATITATILLVGCATAYQDSSGSFTGGYSAKRLEGDIYRVSFHGNSYTTQETVQTYWLYQCTEVALANGFEGFEIISNITLTKNLPVDEFFYSKNQFKKAQFYYIPMDYDPKPKITADIRLLKAPFEVSPPKIFDAKLLQDALFPYVQAEKKCNSDNVCDHVHKYLHPVEKF